MCVCTVAHGRVCTACVHTCVCSTCVGMYVCDKGTLVILHTELYFADDAVIVAPTKDSNVLRPL